MKTIGLLFVIISVLLTNNTQAGVYGEDLSRCLVDSSSDAEKLVFTKWMTAMTLHPAVRHMATVTDEERELINREMADLWVLLCAEKCRDELEKAKKYEGEPALRAAFQVFGGIASRELFSNPAVIQGTAEIQKYVDKEAIRELFGVSQK